LTYNGTEIKDDLEKAFPHPGQILYGISDHQGKDQRAGDDDRTHMQRHTQAAPKGTIREQLSEILKIHKNLFAKAKIVEGHPNSFNEGIQGKNQ